MVKEIAPLLWIVAIAAIFWLLIIRPAQRRQREISQVQSSLAPGDEVVLTSGIYGTIVAIDDEGIAMISIAPGVEIKLDRRAIGSVVRDEELEPEHADETVSEDATTSIDDDNEER